ncbi:hypothetical protein ES705_50693 [subsurface metagenome]
MTELEANSIVFGFPMASMAMSAPPPVRTLISLISALSSLPEALIVDWAPNFLAISSFLSTISTAMTEPPAAAAT